MFTRTGIPTTIMPGDRGFFEPTTKRAGFSRDGEALVFDRIVSNDVLRILDWIGEDDACTLRFFKFAGDLLHLRVDEWIYNKGNGCFEFVFRSK